MGTPSDHPLFDQRPHNSDRFDQVEDHHVHLSAVAVDVGDAVWAIRARLGSVLVLVQPLLSYTLLGHACGSVAAPVSSGVRSTASPA
ncbi:hypothetical protein LRL17_04075 [Rhodococcus qingshengii]|uniref:hypothetical protein n=1 Tax=Rhodococcus qingshengii TaxID=334542 RepID=UPI001E36756D|nr:hypothetical protein [Rhodococcus qingshengii]UGQ52920.1 hypothetical protein LRL17_04075 [Rhodococcus qingshengii]